MIGSFTTERGVLPKIGAHNGPTLNFLRLKEKLYSIPFVRRFFVGLHICFSRADILLLVRLFDTRASILSEARMFYQVCEY